MEKMQLEERIAFALKSVIQNGHIEIKLKLEFALSAAKNLLRTNTEKQNIAPKNALRR